MKDFTILAHNYVRPEVQAMADFVGDSLELAQRAKMVTTEYLVFAGVDFMAEMAAIVNPSKKVIHPEPFSMCAMASRVTPEMIVAARRKYPGAAVVTYVNSSAAVKAVSDIICTSANAVKVVNSLDQQQVIFAPDRNLALYVARHTDKQVIPVPALGCCPVHHSLSVQDIRDRLAEYPGAEVIVHPETIPEVQDVADFIGSTSAMVRHAKTTTTKVIIVGTEVGLLTRLKKESPDKIFVAASPLLSCADMKMITVEKIDAAIRARAPLVQVDPAVAEGARRALERMLAVS